MFEDQDGHVAVHGAEDILVTSEAETLKVLEESQKRKRVAETLMNKHSSRSHCIFTITVHCKESSDCDDVIKTGKINLVDLAGSECIGRSGAEKEHAKEAGKINRSLLTLGRVISALVEKRPHIPYR
jgi:kinesin family protein 11